MSARGRLLIISDVAVRPTSLLGGENRRCASRGNRGIGAIRAAADEYPLDVNRSARWGAVAIVVLAFILVPFALLEGRVHDWTLQRVHANAPASSVALAVVVLLAADMRYRCRQVS
jgi:hypothetical protein